MVQQNAPGWPGIAARWTSSAKVGVGTAIDPTSRVWFTLSHGIFNEVYFRRIDHACIRDMGLLVTDGRAFFSEEKRHTQHEVFYPEEGVPHYHLVNTCQRGRYRIEKEIVADPHRDVILQYTRFTPLQGTLQDYHLYVLLAPHLENQGAGNSGWVGEVKGIPALFARREDAALALACSANWLARSVGYVGESDGWQDLHQHLQMRWHYTYAENGNIALTGEVDLQACQGEFVLALAFSGHPLEAGHEALASLFDGFDKAKMRYLTGWQTWQQSLLHLDLSTQQRNVYRASALVLRSHLDKVFLGGEIASLSIPWGNARGDHDLGGYHLVWTRDLVEATSGLMAIGAGADALEVLNFLHVTQEADGHWSQNMWLDGTPYWAGVQMDEVAFPILLVGIALREGYLALQEITKYLPMVRRATSYLVKNGPVTQQDRWEEDAGYSPFTLAAEIAALLVAADLIEHTGDGREAAYLRDTADTWNAAIERWTYVTGTTLAQRHGVEGYYIRMAPPQAGVGEPSSDMPLTIKNRPPEDAEIPARNVVSCDALALVRFGLRAPDDPHMLNTVKVIDAELKVETPFGPIWHRYTGDGYGEHADGAAFDGTGIGRAWPLLVGERAHYELAADHHEEAERLRQAMEAFSNEGGMLPEQIWDAADIPARELYCGRPSGSAMPLVWAHAEYVKLCRSLRLGQIFDLLPQPSQRYLLEQHGSKLTSWRFNNKARGMPVGNTLRIEVLAPARIHWSADGWKTIQDTDTTDTGLGVSYADLPTAEIATGDGVCFTFYWVQASCWEGRDFVVRVKTAD